MRIELQGRDVGNAYVLVGTRPDGCICSRSVTKDAHDFAKEYEEACAFIMEDLQSQELAVTELKDIPDNWR